MCIAGIRRHDGQLIAIFKSLPSLHSTSASICDTNFEVNKEAKDGARSGGANVDMCNKRQDGSGVD